MAKTKVQVEFEALTSKFTSGITAINKDINNLNKQLRTNKTQLNGNSKNVDLLTERKKLLKAEITKTDQKIELINKTLVESINKFGANSDEARKWQNSLEDAKNKQALLQNELKKTNKEIELNSSKLVKVKNILSKNGKVVTSLGKKLSVLSGTFATLGIVFTKASIDFETAFTGVKKTVNATDKQLQQIKTGIQEMAKELPASTTEISSVAEAAGQLGIATEDILSFTRVMIDLGEATNLEATEAASALAKFANVTNMSAKDYSKLGSVIVDLGNNFATTERDIVEMATRLAASGELAGLTEAQIMALATAMSSVGIEAEAGGSAMSKLLKKIQIAVETGSNDLKDYAKVAGMTSNQFKQSFEKDAVEALSAFIAGLNDTERNGKSATVILNEMDLTEIRLSNTILSLANSSGVMKDAIKRANNAWNENNALTKEAETRYATTESKLKIFKNNVNNLAITFGNLMIPKLNEVVNKLNSFVNWLQKLNPQTQNTILKIGTFIAVLAPLLIGIGKVSEGIANSINLYKKLKESITLTTIAQKTWNIITTTFSAITKIATIIQTGLNAAFWACPITWLVAAILALVAIIVVLWNKCDWFRNFWISVWNKVKEVTSSVVNTCIAIFNKVIDFFKNNWKQILLFIVNPFAGAFALVYQNCTKFREFINNFLSIISNFFKGIGNWINNYLVQPLNSLLNDYIIPIITKIVQMIRKVGEIIVSVFVGVFNLLKINVIDPIILVINELWQKIVSVFSTIGQWFKDRFNEVVLGIQTTFSVIGQWFIEKYNQIKNIFSPVATFFKTIFSNAYRNIKSAFSGIGSFFGNLWTQIKSKFTSLGTALGKAMSDTFKSGLNKVISLIESTINTGVNMLNKAIGLVNKLPGVSVSKIDKLKLPRLKIGMDFVPSDYFPAYLDYGERVLTREENALFNKLGGLKGMFANKMRANNTFINDNSSLISLLRTSLNRPIYLIVDGKELAESTTEPSENISGKRIVIKNRGVEV